MATESIVYVDPDAGGSGTGVDYTNAYTSLQVAQKAKAKNLTISDEIYIFLCRSSGGTADTTSVLIDSSWICDSTRYVVFRADNSDKAKKTGWNTSKYRLEVTDDECFNIISYTSIIYLRLEYLQYRRKRISVSWQSALDIAGGAAGSELRINSCFCSCEHNQVNGIRLRDADYSVYIYNTIISGTFNLALSTTASSMYLYNAIIEGAVTGVDISAGVTAELKNSAIFNNGNDINDGATSTIDYNATDDGDGTHVIAPLDSDWANEFSDYANGDFTLIAGGNCEDGGTDNPGSGLYTTDIDGDNYTTPWSVGVDEYLAVVLSFVQVIII